MKIIYIFFLGIFLLNGVSAISGVSPGSYKIDFEPNLQKDFVFDFFIDEDSYVQPYVTGDLSEYVTLDKNKIYGREKVVASINLPEELINKDGEIRIIAGSTVGIIKINFADSNKYFKIDLRAPNFNVGETAKIEFDIFNIENNINISPVLEIYSVDDLEIPLDSFSWDSEVLQDHSFFHYSFNTSSYSFGEYVAIVIINHDEKEFKEKNYFYLGKKDLEILNYTKELKENKIGKFEIDVKSFWSNEVNDLYAQITVVGTNYSFTTSHIKLDSLGKGKLVGFFDTNEISNGNKKLDIILFYEDKIKNEIVDFKIKKGFDFVLLFVILAACGVSLLIIIKGKSFLQKLNKFSEEEK